MFILRLISSRLSLVFVSVTPRCLNLSTFLNDKFQLSIPFYIYTHGYENAYFLATSSPKLVHRCSTRRPFMTLIIGGAQCDVLPWQCIPLPFDSRFIRLCSYAICFLDVYLVCHGGGLTTKHRQPQ